MKREILSNALNGLDEKYISETARFSPGAVQDSPERIVHMKKKRILTLALAAVLILALGSAAYALSGLPRSIGTYAMPNDAVYSRLADIPKIEKDVGYPIVAPESFSNGYRFEILRVGGEAVFGESNEVLQDYYGVHVIYSRPGSPNVFLDLSPVLEIEADADAPAPSEVRSFDGVTVRLNRDHYKVVPPDYEKTDLDLAREAAGHYYISYGSDTITEHEMAFASFELNGVQYVLMDMTAAADTLDTLADMASEVIAAAK